MNRLEQIQEASKANLEKKEDEILHVFDRHAGFMEGAEWAFEQIKDIVTKAGFYSDFSTKCFLYGDLKEYLNMED